MMKMVALMMTVITMLTIGIYNFTLGFDRGGGYVRLNDEESVSKWINSGNFNETGNVYWNLDSEEL